MSDFLLELGLEEIPARMIAGAEAELGRRVGELLKRERLLGPDAKVTTYSTLRRLAVLAQDVVAKQADTEEQLTGPSWKVAFKDSEPTAAAQAFAKKAGVTVSELKKVESPKGEYVGATVKRAGRTANEILAAELPKEVLAIYWAKNMYWRVGKPERFVRPVRWVVALMDSAVVPLEIAGIAAGDASRGHRVLHGHSVLLPSAKSYADTLRAAFVIVDVAERRQIIRKALDAATRTVQGARWREDEELVETVAHLTEWPTVILGSFEREFLELPEEVLVTVMRDHQKYFAVEDAQGKLAPHFLAVLNTQADEEGAAIIRHGNERVLRARFKDARFFWDVDQKVPLAERVESLKAVTFKKELGSYYWKTLQNLAVVEELAKMAQMESGCPAFDLDALRKATELAKTDLTTELVKEFTELQGIVGGLYARAQGLGTAVGSAIYHQFRPSWAGDRIPPTPEGQLLGLADRIQTITAMFDKGFEPTGSKDPFALRRAASAIIRILAESGLPLTLEDVLHAPGTESGQGVGPNDKLQPDSAVRAFLKERQRFDLQEARGFSYDVVNAVLATNSNDVRDAIARAEALTAARGSEDFLAVSAAFKRMKNILRQAESVNAQIGTQLNFIQPLVEAEGVRLWHETQRVFGETKSLVRERRYEKALRIVGTLRPWVDAFFDKPVVVMHEDPNIRGVRLLLLLEVSTAFLGIADFSEIVTG